MAVQTTAIRAFWLVGKTQFLPTFVLIAYTSWCQLVSHVTTSGANCRRMAISYAKSTN